MKIGKEIRNKCNLYINTYNRFYLTGKYCVNCGYNVECEAISKTGKKNFKIQAKVHVVSYSPYSSESMIADMLRYDCMKIISKRIEGEYSIFELEGNVRYTKGRWDSFGIKTELIK